MQMITITHDQSFIPKEEILSITERMLLDYKLATPEPEYIKLGYALLATMDKFEKDGDKELAARAAYLLSYSLFHLLVPPGSAELALRYAEMALEWNPTPFYEEWKSLVLEGN